MRIHADPVELKITTAIPAGMIVAELITNSLKHSFRSFRETQNTISISTRLDNTGMLTLCYRDSGNPGGSLRREPEMGNMTVLEFSLQQQ